MTETFLAFILHHPGLCLVKVSHASSIDAAGKDFTASLAFILNGLPWFP